MCMCQWSEEHSCEIYNLPSVFNREISERSTRTNYFEITGKEENAVRREEVVKRSRGKW